MNETAAGGVPQCRKYVYAGVVAVGILLSGVRAKGLFASCETGGCMRH